MTLQYWLLLWGLLALCVNAQYENCTVKLSVLEKALYETDSNERSLNKAFFPPRQETSRYITVTYRFLTDDKDGSYDDCYVSYIWTIGGFLIIQPPNIFKFTSLLFSTPANDVDELTLTLPSQCRELAGIGDKCSCDSQKNHSLNLDILSQQILEYSKYNNYNSIVRDDKSPAQAVCTENIEQQFYSLNSVFYLVVTFLLPIFIVPYIIMYVQIYFKELEEILLKPSSHHHIAALVLCGVYTSVFILVMDILAIFFNFFEKMEYGGCGNCRVGNDVFILTNLVIELFVLIGMMALICLLRREPQHLSKCFILNHSNIRTFSNEKQTEAAHLWSLVIFMLVPLWYVSSHIGYVIVSWLTEPSKSTSVALLVMAVYLYIYMTTRTMYQRLKDSSAETFDFKALIKALFGGLWTMLGVCIVIAAFSILPLPTSPLPSYIENIAQIFLVFLAALVSYKLISVQDSDTQKFLKNFEKRCGGEDIRVSFRGIKNNPLTTYTVNSIQVEINGENQVFTLPELEVTLKVKKQRDKVTKAKLQHEVLQNAALQENYIRWLNQNPNPPISSPWVSLKSFRILPNCMIVSFSDNRDAVLLPPYRTDFVIRREENNNNNIRASIRLRDHADITFIADRTILSGTRVHIRNIAMPNLISVGINNNAPVSISSFNITIDDNGDVLLHLTDYDPVVSGIEETTVIIGYFRKLYTGDNQGLLKAYLTTDYQDNYANVGNVVGSIASKM